MLPEKRAGEERIKKIYIKKMLWCFTVRQNVHFTHCCSFLTAQQDIRRRKNRYAPAYKHMRSFRRLLNILCLNCCLCALCCVSTKFRAYLFCRFDSLRCPPKFRCSAREQTSQHRACCASPSWRSKNILETFRPRI